MSKSRFTSRLNDRKAIQSDLQLIFDDISTAVNTDKITPSQVRPSAIMRRHLKLPPDIYIRDEKVGVQMFPSSLTKSGAWNWSNCFIKHSPFLPDAFGNPVALVRAKYISHEFEAGNYELGIGYSTDNGATYTLYPGTNRWFGYRNAWENPLWTGKIPHPITGTTNYWSPSMYGMREVESDMALINASGGPDVRTITNLAIGLRVNGTGSLGTGTKNAHAKDYGEIYLIGRDIQ